MLGNRGRRQQVVVNKRFQFQYAVAGALYIGVIAICLSMPFIPLINTMKALLVDEPPYLIQLVERQEKFALLTFVLCSAWLAAAWVLFSLRRSHRIAGPARKLSQFMDGITRNNIDQRVSLRTNDELQELAVAVNAMLDRIETGDKTPSREPEPATSQPSSPETHPVG